uniref:FZ domain-containing protein n=1 Tax=Arion vulgaris TaxID=1028688 RepID=A0A0B6ZVQ7_9EUPU
MDLFLVNHGSSTLRRYLTITITVLLMFTMSCTATTTYPQTDPATVIPARKCEQIQVPMCKGLIKYNSTKLPNRFGHVTQTDVYWALQPWWPFIDAGCSDNLRNFLCALYLPKCVGDDSDPQYPCQETCKKAKVRCQKTMRRQNIRWSPDFKCNALQPKSSKLCVKPERERKKKYNKEYVLCQVNKLPMCQGIPFPQGSLPNMFLQGDLQEIETEMQQFQPIVNSGCSRKFRLFMCGVYMPFCVPGAPVEDEDSNEGSNDVDISRHPDVPFVVPCKELCQEIQDQCGKEYQQMTNGLPWPSKFHCHRYPSYIDRYARNGTLGRNHIDLLTNRGGTKVPCTMSPYSYNGD